MMNMPSLMGRGLSAVERDEKPALDVPIVMCPACKKRPMAIKSVRQPVLKKSADSRVEMVCPKCGANTTITMGGGAQPWPGGHTG